LISVDTEQTNSQQAVTDEQARAAWMERKCAACERSKPAQAAFCPTCTAALTMWVRNWLAQGPLSAHWCDQYRSALRHLQLNPNRKRLLPANLGRWAYESEDDLARAGYRFINHDWCKVPGCRTRIVWYWTPAGNRIPVNLADYQPHRMTCADPEYFQRQRAEREAQASAKKAKRTRA
jgi:hypothetical protein